MDTAPVTPMPSPHPSPRRIQRTANTTHSIPRRQMAPPIIIDNIKNGTTLLKSLQAVTKTKLTAKLTGTSLRIYPQTAHAYHKIRHYIDEQKLQAHTYMLPEEKKIKAVIRGMPIDMPPTEIAEELLEKNITAEEPKDAPPVNRWRLRAAARAPRVDPQQTQELSTEDFPPLPTQPKPKKTPPQEDAIATDPFTILKHPKCRELYKEMMEFVNIAQNIPTKA
ncbi:hypothetical protein NPIL_454411, partial [Nephila pilipes]